ncbi:MAG: class I SAM-dependent methyltransferase [Planctomycetota bacterium]
MGVDLRTELGNLDIYLFDQIHRGHVRPPARILDAGCGRGRNLTYFLRHGFEVWANDPNQDALADAKAVAMNEIGVADDEHFRCEPIEDLEFENSSFDFIICNAVLHFARDVEHFDVMIHKLRDLLRPGGRAFCRLASDIGVEVELPHVGGKGERWRRFPDETEYFLVDLEFLLDRTQRLKATIADPIKTVNVQNRRWMSTWVWTRDT